MVKVATRIDPYDILWCVFLWELPQVRFTEMQLNKRLAGCCELTSIARECSRPPDKQVFNQLCPTSLVSAPKRKLAIGCHMGFYGRQSHSRTHAHKPSRLPRTLLLAGNPLARREPSRSPQILAAINLSKISARCDPSEDIFCYQYHSACLVKWLTSSLTEQKVVGSNLAVFSLFCVFSN